MAHPKPRGRVYKNLSQETVYRTLTRSNYHLALNHMDESAGQYSMEARHPFLDLRLIEFFLSIPAEIKLADGYRKTFFQRALQPMMPWPIREVEDERCFIPEVDKDKERILGAGRLRSYLMHADAQIFDYVSFSQIDAMTAVDSKNWNTHFALLLRLSILEKWFQNNFPKKELQKEIQHEWNCSPLSA